MGQTDGMLFIGVAGVVARAANAQSHGARADALVEVLRTVPVEMLDGLVAVMDGSAVRPTPTPAPEVASAGHAANEPLTLGEVIEAVEDLGHLSSSVERDDIVSDLLRRSHESERWMLTSAFAGRPVFDGAESALQTAAARVANVRVRDIRRAVGLTGSLGSAIQLAVGSGGAALHDLDVLPGRPVRLMAASPADTVESAVRDAEPVFVERRLTGTRVQIHRVDGVVTLFDDRLVDVSDDYPRISAIMARLPRADLVLDAVIGEDPGADGAGAGVSLFDVLYDSASMVDTPLRERRKALASIVPVQLRLAYETVAHRDAVRELLDDPSHLDGVVIKDPESAYECGGTGHAWRAIDPARSSETSPSRNAVATDQVDYGTPGSASDAGPRLPDAPTPAHPGADPVAGAAAQSDHRDGSGRNRSTSAAAALVADADFDPYVEPVLHTEVYPMRLVLGARAVAVVWSLAVTLVAIAVRRDPQVGHGRLLASVGLLGVAVVGVLVVAGWMWSDQLTRNLKRLDGRLPSRLRNVSAWAAPVVMSLLLSVTVVRLKPTELVDLRPLVIVALFPWAVARPYSLVRRILQTLIRIRSDGVLASAWLIDVFAFGLLWWRISVTAERGVAPGGSDLDVLVGVGSAVSIALLANVLVWRAITTATARGEAHRASSQRTRYEHRMLRRRGVDPRDPEVWWALVQRRNDEIRAAEQVARAAAAESAASIASKPPESITLDGLLTEAVTRNRAALRRLGVPQSEAMLGRLREKFASAVDLLRHDPSPVDDPAGGARSRSGERNWSPIATLRHALGLVRADQHGEFGDLVSQAGSVEIEAALRERSQGDAEQPPSQRLVTPRLYALEVPRLLLVLAFALLAASAVYLVGRTLSVESMPGGALLDPGTVDQLDSARTWFAFAFVGSTVFTPGWAWMVHRYARRCGLAPSSELLNAWLLGVDVVAVVAAILSARAGSDGLALGAAAAAVACAVTAAMSVEPVRYWFGLRSAGLIAWAVALPMIYLTAWLGGLHTSIGPDAAVQRLTFVTVLVALYCTLLLVLAALSSGDVEDEIRISRELAVPASDVVGRR